MEWEGVQITLWCQDINKPISSMQKSKQKKITENSANN